MKKYSKLFNRINWRISQIEEIKKKADKLRNKESTLDDNLYLSYIKFIFELIQVINRSIDSLTYVFNQLEKSKILKTLVIYENLSIEKKQMIFKKFK